ncbi:hypothetical protein K505DRAFT_371434 [Melanomma pulvis-pyrius CBS 109.77]|uniref:MARVEL domain-containing protein n=1 Tax=Melanomma pulvis-pyrius CBS 109.77 TaxID=1314802 RepID=A0A6A6XQH5_9PLEO|nr:hypothetical protein K505DRAFT_371434 [Melanomma pulvis-pyrius CBS 109.77]
MGYKIFLENKLKNRLHIIMLLLTVAVMGLAGARMFMIKGQRTRSDSMALAMGAKSLVFLAYQLCTEHMRRFKRWASLKAYFIINAMEVIFWVAVAGLNVQSNMKRCRGTTCALSWVVVVIAGVIHFFSGWMAAICWCDWRYFKAWGVERGATSSNSSRSGLTNIDIEARK